MVGDVPTVLGALRSRLPGTTIEFARGCDVLGDDRRGFDEAVGVAARSDVAVLVVGDKAGLTAGCPAGESHDVASLDLPGVQEHLVRAVAATGTPVILVLVAGRPIGSPGVHAAAAAVWQEGLETPLPEPADLVVFGASHPENPTRRVVFLQF